MELPFGSWAVEASGGCVRCRSRPAKLCWLSLRRMRASARLPSSGERPIKAPPKGVKQNREFGVMLAIFHRVGPLAGLTVALVAMVGWMALLGYVAIEIF
jgi:hypothetical protein